MNSTKVASYASQPKAVVLVVDDEEAICSSLADVLSDEGFETVVSHDGADALSKICVNAPDLVFLDIWMPGTDGMETLEKIKEISPDTAVIMMSGHATITNALDAMKKGAFDFIEKPFDIESVIRMASRALERKKIKGELHVLVEPCNGSETKGLKDSSLSRFVHRGILSQGMKGRNVGQRTLRDSVILYGHCLHSGMKSGLVLEPLPRDSGIHFAQIGSSTAVPVFVDYVESTAFATTIRSGTASVSTIEHLMAVLHAYRISNLLIKCNGEVPILDGSAREFCKVIESVGLEEQGGEWFEIAIDKKLEISQQCANDISKVMSSGLESLSIEPAEQFSIEYDLDYPQPVGRQQAFFSYNNAEGFKELIAPARTFGFMKDVELLQRAGLAAGGRLNNFILIGNDKIVNTELRFSDELARHKILDAIGDLFLIGRPIRGKVKARMTGHSDNVKLLKLIADNISDLKL